MTPSVVSAANFWGVPVLRASGDTERHLRCKFRVSPGFAGFGGLGDAEVATDAAAETYSQALGRGDDLVDPGAWIWRTAFRVAGGLLADRSRHWRQLESVDLGRAQATDDPELVEFLDQLSTLSEQQRSVVVLRYSGGFTPSEIAEVLDTTPNSVRVKLHRAHTHLRERIDRQ